MFRAVPSLTNSAKDKLGTESSAAGKSREGQFADEVG